MSGESRTWTEDEIRALIGNAQRAPGNGASEAVRATPALDVEAICTRFHKQWCLVYDAPGGFGQNNVMHYANVERALKAAIAGGAH